MNVPELLAPAGSPDALRAAFCYGADAVYLGGRQFGARAYAENFSEAALLDGITLAHRLHKKLYLTVNTLVKDAELEELRLWLRPFYEAGLDAVIVQDLGVLRMLACEFPELPLHASTQMTVTGVYGARLLQDLGVSRIIPAREISLKEIRAIREDTGMEVEVFIHGALCYSYSGACLMSSLLGGRSGNRGRCAGICRLPFSVQRNDTILTSRERNYPLNMKDLCAIDRLPSLVAAGVSSFKIEGRMKKPEYVAGVVEVYRRALDHLLEKGAEDRSWREKISSTDRDRLFSLYNRDGFTEGYFSQYNGASMIALENRKLQRQRMQSAQQTTEMLRKDLQKKEAQGALQQAVDGVLRLRADEPVTLTITAISPGRKQTAVGSNGIRVTGPLAEKAKTRPLTEEEIRHKLEKTGREAYAFSDLQIDMEGEIFVPMQAFSALRHAAFMQCEAACQAPFRRSYRPEKNNRCEFPVATGEEAPFCLFASVLTEDQLQAVLEKESVAGVYLPFPLRHAVREVRAAKKQCFLSLPWIFRTPEGPPDREMEAAIASATWDGLLLHTLDEIGWYITQRKRGIPLPPATLDATVYTMNKESVLALRELGLARRTLPYELQFREWRRQPTAGAEVVLYGRTPLMFSVQCVKKTMGVCDRKPELVYLTDRKGMKFPVFCACTSCGSVIFNSLPTRLLEEREALRHLQASAGRLDFTTEDLQETREVLAAFCTVFLEEGEAHLSAGATRGHFRRGIL